jgi:thiol-disulfide isomerase/thioredoxin
MALVVAAALLASACGPISSPPVSREPAARAVSVSLVDYDGLMDEVGKHRGKVVVLDCWSTSCPPCVKEFPGLVALAAAHGGDIVCMSLAIEYDGIGTPDEYVPPVQAFLEKIDAKSIKNFIASQEADVMYKKLDLASVPAIFVWGRDGALAIRYDDDMASRSLGRPFTYDDVETTVAAILADSATIR